MEKEKLSKRIYDYFNLDKKLNRNWFVFSLYFFYFFILYFLPLFYINFIVVKNRFGSALKYPEYYLWPAASSFGKVFLKLVTQPIDLIKGLVLIYYNTWIFLIQNLPDSFFKLVLAVYFLLSPIFLIIIPSIIIRKILPKFKLKYLLLLGG